MGAIDGTENKGKKNKIGVLFVLFYHDEKRVESHLGSVLHNTLLANSMGMASTLRLPTYHNG